MRFSERRKVDLPQPEGPIRARITSYNVCYTKLLRKGETAAPWQLAGTVGAERTDERTPEGWRDFEFHSMNKMDKGTPVEYVGPDIASVPDGECALIDPETGLERDWVSHGHPCLIRTKRPVAERWIVRMRAPEAHPATDGAVPETTRVPRVLR